jgi:hypothetical protein
MLICLVSAGLQYLVLAAGLPISNGIPGLCSSNDFLRVYLVPVDLWTTAHKWALKR